MGLGRPGHTAAAAGPAVWRHGREPARAPNGSAGKKSSNSFPHFMRVPQHLPCHRTAAAILPELTLSPCSVHAPSMLCEVGRVSSSVSAAAHLLVSGACLTVVIPGCLILGKKSVDLQPWHRGERQQVAWKVAQVVWFIKLAQQCGPHRTVHHSTPSAPPGRTPGLHNKRASQQLARLVWLGQSLSTEASSCVCMPGVFMACGAASPLKNSRASGAERTRSRDVQGRPETSSNVQKRPGTFTGSASVQARAQSSIQRLPLW